MELSVVIATRNKSSYLYNTLSSIVDQRPPFDYEVIVVDDGSTDSTKMVCEAHYAQYIRLEKGEYSNPGIARNVGYKAAKGRVIVTQSDEVIHISPRYQTLETLYNLLKPQTALIANVHNATWNGLDWTPREVYTSAENGSGLFFLAALWREDIFAVGGNDPDFTDPGGEDAWLCWCIQNRSKLVWTDEVVGYHQDHQRPPNTNSRDMDTLAHYKKAQAENGLIPWCSSTGPWKFNG